MNSTEIRERFPYFYETHLHTSAGSACAKGSPEEMVRACKAYGYTGIIVTEHNWSGNTAVDRNLSWEEWVDAFCQGYERARAEGERIGLDVFFGYESGYQGTEFLIYGVDGTWLKSHPQIENATVEEQYRLIHGAGGLVMHAHPYRQAPYIPETRLYPEWVDGVEGVNAAHSNPKSVEHYHPDYDEKAIAYAHEHGLRMSAGSDIHMPDLWGGGMAFRKRLRSVEDYVQAVLGGEDYVLTDGKVWYDKSGRVISIG